MCQTPQAGPGAGGGAGAAGETGRLLAKVYAGARYEDGIEVTEKGVAA